MRFRVTILGKEVELRGYVDGEDNLRGLASAVRGFGTVVASAADDDYNPFSEIK